MIKLTVLYGHPTDTGAFERYYLSTHLPIVETMKGYTKAELTLFMPQADNSPAPFYRMAEFWFDGPEALQATMGSPEGQATAADLANFATGGVSVLVGLVTSV